MKRILILDDNLTICLMLKSWLAKEGYDAATATNVNEAKNLIKDNPFDLILSDIRMPETDGFSFLSWIKKYDSAISVIMMTSFSDVETAVESMKMGAVDYISKPIDPQSFFRKIEEAFTQQENKAKCEPCHRMFVKPPSEKYKTLFRQLDTISFQDTPVFIYGERGTGKASVARYIYEKGHGAAKPFVQIDECLAEEQPFSGNDKKGERGFLKERLKKAIGGVLYICEIGNLSRNMQNELLSFLQSQEDDPGSIRLIASSTKKRHELKTWLTPKLFGLFEKIQIRLTPLANQKREILFFTDHFLSFANSEFNKDIKRIAPGFVERLLEYSWPGNIQELKNLIIKAALLTDDSEIKACAVPDLLINPGKGSEANIPEIKMEALKKENYEREKIQEALDLARGNKTLAASILNIDRKTLYNKIKAYRVEIPN